MGRKLKRKCGVYKITNPVGQIYIGASVNIQNRLSRYKNLNCRGQVKLYNSIANYGWDAHVVEIIIECKKEELHDLEKYYVDQYNCFNSDAGLNLRDGGGSKARHSEVSKLKMSQNLKGKIVISEAHKERLRMANTGKKLSEETKKKMGSSKIGEKNHRYGVKMSDETKQKIRAFYKDGPKGRDHFMYGRKHSAETRAKLSVLMTGENNPNFGKPKSKDVVDKIKTANIKSCGKPVLQISMDGVQIKRWDCINDASRTLGINRRNIAEVCKERSRIAAGGFKWKFETKNKQ